MTRAERKRVSAARLIVALSLVVPLAGCLSVSENKDNYYQFGAITVTAPGGAGAVVPATANALFFQALAASVPDSRAIQNGCSYAVIDTGTATSQGDLRAGSALTMLTGAGSAKATTTIAFNSASGTYLGTSGLTYKVGDSASVSVPGESGGFPASNIAVRLAEPIIPEDITVPPANTNMTVRWNVGDSTSAIILSIRYANPASAATPNEQVLCTLRDDGNEDISSSALVAFLASPASKRSVKITRWRTNAMQPNSRALLHIVSTSDSTAKLK